MFHLDEYYICCCYQCFLLKFFLRNFSNTFCQCFLHEFTNWHISLSLLNMVLNKKSCSPEFKKLKHERRSRKIIGVLSSKTMRQSNKYRIFLVSIAWPHCSKMGWWNKKKVVALVCPPVRLVSSLWNFDENNRASRRQA